MDLVRPDVCVKIAAKIILQIKKGALCNQCARKLYLNLF